MKARDRIREVLDALTSEVTGDSLVVQKATTEVQKKFLTRVLTYYQDLAEEQSDDERSRKRAASAALTVGLIEYRLDNLEAAARAFRFTCQLYAALDADFPFVYRQSLAVSHFNLGLMLKNLRKLEEAETEYRDALGIQASLTGTVASVLMNLPESRPWLARFHDGLGDLLKDRKKWTEADSEYRKALAIWMKLTSDYPNDPVYRAELALSHNDLGISLADRRHDAYRGFPWVGGGNKDLGIIFLADRRRQKRVEANAEYRKALAIQEKLVAEFPAAPQYRTEFSQTHFFIACLYAASSKEWDKKQDDIERAMEWLNMAVNEGYSNAAQMAKDKDLDPLRDRADFKQLLAKLENPPEIAPPPRAVK